MELSLTMPLSLLEIALVPVSIRIDLFAFSMLHVILPVSFVGGASFGMNIGTMTMCLVIEPLSCVGITVDVNKLSLTGGPAIYPVALVFGPIWPDLDPVSILHPIDIGPRVLNPTAGTSRWWR